MSVFDEQICTRIDRILDFSSNESAPSLNLKREDEIHEDLSGNKWRKLKYNIEKAVIQSFPVVLTFGGAFSNHIAATAAACSFYKIKSIGIIRGEETVPLNPTLKKAIENGMEIHYISREEYRQKEDWDYLDSLRVKYGRFLHLPEGGSNYLGINGCIEILDEDCAMYDVITVPVGTAGTISGMALSLKDNQRLIGFSALKGVDQLTVIRKNISQFLTDEDSLDELMARIEIVDETKFGGYAKISPELIQFLIEFKNKHQIKLDPIYTGKMMFRLLDLINSGSLDAAENILGIHTGGLQGINGFKHRNLLLDY